MGRKTWESLPKSKRPLPNRLNVILSQNDKFELLHAPLTDGTPKPIIFPGLEQVFEYLNGLENIGEIYVVGGSGVFLKCLTKYKDQCKFVIGTRINKDYPDADVFMPEFSLEDWPAVFIS